jgi:hypothetical protein
MSTLMEAAADPELTENPVICPTDYLAWSFMRRAFSAFIYAAKVSEGHDKHVHDALHGCA